MSAPNPRAPPSRSKASAGRTRFGNGNGVDTITSGLEGAWTTTPTKWSNNYFENLFGYEWELTKSPAGAQSVDTEERRRQRAPCRMPTIRRSGTPRSCSPRTSPCRLDPSYATISKRFHENPEEFADAFAKAWYKLTHRDMGPISRYLGPLVPKEPLLWQDPVPAVDHELIGEQDIAALKAKILASGLSDLPTGHDGLGVGGDVPRLRQARRRERGAHSPRAAKGLGSEPAGRTGEGPAEAGGDPKGVQQLAVRREEGFAC